MSETDSIWQLLSQVKELNEVLDTEQTFPADQLKALRLLRLNLMSLVSNSSSQLKQIADAVQQITTAINPDLAIFTSKGQLSSYAQSLEILLDSKLTESIFSNSSQEKKFQDENKHDIDAAELPWKKDLNNNEALEPRLFLSSESSGEPKWLSCLLTKLLPVDAEQSAGNESARAACFTDATPFVKAEQRLNTACSAFANEKKEIDTANLEIEYIKERLKKGNQQNRPDLETFLPRTFERPPIDQYADEESKRVLVVDDIAINQKLLAKRLQKLGLECDFASNGQQGIEMAVTGKYALIFMDCEMPIVDGFQATHMIRLAELETGRHVPIIALTSYDRADDRERCLSAGMDEYLSKGASPNLLQEVVEWCLRRSRTVEGQDLSITDYEEDLDLATLSSTFSRDELNEVFDMFLPSTNTLMRCLRMSMDERDVRSVGHFAYSLKGPFASLGMVMTSKLTARLTDAAEEKQWEEANDYYEMLARNCETMRQQLEERAAKQG